MKLLKYIFLSSVFFFGATACTDDELDAGGNSQNSGQATEGIYFQFKISVPVLGNSTRAGSDDVEKYENYIDPDKLSIMFFLKDDQDTDRLYKIFPPKDPVISLIPVAYSSSESFYKEDWYVKISITDMEDGDEFASILRKNDFKIAVMANQELTDELNQATGKTFTMNGAEATIDGTGTNIPGSLRNFKLGDELNMIHRQSGANDPYVKAELKEGNLVPSSSLKEVYGFLYQDRPSNSHGYLGQYTDWVKSRDADIKSDAAGFIRGRIDPKNPSTWYLDYKNLWSLWNFGGNVSNSACPYTNTFGVSWEIVNGARLREILGEENGAPLGNFSTGEMITDDSGDIIYSPEEIYLQYTDFNEEEAIATAIISQTADGKTLYGISLPKDQHSAGINDGSYYRYNPVNGGCLSFTATATGHLKIRGAGNGTLIAQIGKKNSYVKFDFNGDDIQEPEAQKISITNNAQTIYLYVDGNNKASDAHVDIYEIEFIEDNYLYETDREGIAPNKFKPIPMYGAQSYGKLEGLWLEGTSFDLNDYNSVSNDFELPSNPEHTYFHPISMLRSVAKVIVRIPTSLKAKHVYLRSANRYARWEPNDVVSNTADFWEDDMENEDFQKYHSTDCEFFNLIDQPPFYNPVSRDNRIQLDSYKKKLAWYYGGWATNGSIGGIPVSTNDTKNDHNDFSYPQIMNPLISRSDFVEFLDAGTEDIYDKYVLYVGEKFADDPNSLTDSKGIENSIPKICHVEFRVEGPDSFYLDDDNCYRIYFTENGFYSNNGANTIPDLSDDDHNWEKSYEQKPDNIQHHWPIVRNHAYQFTVQDINSQLVIVSLEVLPWRKVNDINIAW